MKKQSLNPEFRSYTSMKGSVSPNLPRSPSAFTTRSRLNRHSIDVGSLVRSKNPTKNGNGNRNNKSKGVLDPTRPCQLKQILTEELTTFSNQNKPRSDLQPSESWILTRKACVEGKSEENKSNRNGINKPKINTKPLPSLTKSPPLPVVKEINNKKNNDKTESLSDKTKRLLRRKKSLNDLIQRVKPKSTATRDDIFMNSLVVPKVMIRSSSDSCMPVSKDFSSLPRPLSATNINTAQMVVQRREFFIQ